MDDNVPDGNRMPGIELDEVLGTVDERLLGRNLTGRGPFGHGRRKGDAAYPPAMPAVHEPREFVCGLEALVLEVGADAGEGRSGKVADVLIVVDAENRDLVWHGESGPPAGIQRVDGVGVVCAEDGGGLRKRGKPLCEGRDMRATFGGRGSAQVLGGVPEPEQCAAKRLPAAFEPILAIVVPNKREVREAVLLDEIAGCVSGDFHVVDIQPARRGARKPVVRNIEEDGRNVGPCEPCANAFRAGKRGDDAVEAVLEDHSRGRRRQFGRRLVDPDIPSDARAEKAEDADELLASGRVAHFECQQDLAGTRRESLHAREYSSSRCMASTCLKAYLIRAENMRGPVLHLCCRPSAIVNIIKESPL